MKIQSIKNNDDKLKQKQNNKKPKFELRYQPTALRIIFFSRLIT